MSKSVNVSRIVLLVVLLMAAIVVLSGPVAGGLDLPEPTAQAKKKKKKNRPQFNVVQCPTEEQNNNSCSGTPGNDFLIGGATDREPFGANDNIFGFEGTDVYNGGNGSDFLVDGSKTSSDVYLLPSTPFSDRDGFPTTIRDLGGDGDIAGLSSYSIEDFTVSRNGNSLRLDGPGERVIVISDFFDGGSFETKIEYFLFREGYFTGDQVAGGATAQQAIAPQEQAALQERLYEAGLSPSGVPAQQQQE